MTLRVDLDGAFLTVAEVAAARRMNQPTVRD